MFTCKCILEQESLGFKVNLHINVAKIWGGNWPLGGDFSGFPPPPPYETLYTEGESGSPSAEDLGDLELCNGLEFENEDFHHSHKNLSALQGKRQEAREEEGGQ